VGGEGINPSVAATFGFTWLVMALLAVGSWLITRRLSAGPRISRWQNLLEIIVGYTRRQIAETAGRRPDRYLPFIGTLFLFIAVSNVLLIVPGFVPPTASLHTTAALAICVFFAVPIYGITDEGVLGYLKHYLRPHPVMLPFHLMGELSRTLALAVRLFGNMMSGHTIVAILLGIVPFFFPAVINILGLLTGMIQAYIFAMLAVIYVASGERARRESEEPIDSEKQNEHDA
jgi:F-type H+-transporting ATPase subunit a